MILLQAMFTAPTAITTVFLIPDCSLPTGWASGDLIPSDFRISYTEVLSQLSNINGYIPKNNKLFSFPYNFVVVDNADNAQLIYKYEYFTSSVVFDIRVASTGNPQMQLFPKNYKGIENNLEECIVISNYPQCAWTTDVYASWLAQNSVSNTIGIASSFLGLVVGMSTLNPISMASGVIGVSSTIGQFYEKSLIPNQVSGTQQNDISVAWSEKTFKFYQKQIREENAKMIDNFLSMYGYKVNELKVPNFTTRPNWNYLKLIEVNIFGNIPNSHLVKIHSIFKNGLTFWHNDNVGNYNRTNEL